MRVGNDFLEVDACQHNKAGNIVCGDSFLSQKFADQGRMVSVLSDGLGSGIKASVLSTLTASMLLNFSRLNDDIMDYAASVLRTLPRDAVRKIGYSTFSLCDVDVFGTARIVEYESPSFLFFRGGKLTKVEKRKIPVERDDMTDTVLWVSELALQKEDRIVFFSDGVSQSGMGKPAMPFGWDEGAAAYIEELLRENPQISARVLAQRVVGQAERNDGGRLQDDTSCCAIYMRKPRNLLVCTGPPFDEKNDAPLAKRVMQFGGKKIVCGGTTAQIIARETGREIVMDMDFSRMDLPPASKIEGIDLVTEGILTLSKVESMLADDTAARGAGPADKMLQMLAEGDNITFLVGTRINVAHQDPTLPVELEIRRNVVKKLKYWLETKWLKSVEIVYI